MKTVILKNQDEDKEFNYASMYNECLVDLSEVKMLPPTALGIGHHEYKGETYLNNTFTYGEFSVIKAKSKRKKTFFKSALIAGYIGGQITNNFPEFKTQRNTNEETHIIDIDTEQGDYYAQRSFRRIADLVGNPYEHYYPFGVEGWTPSEIISFIDGLFNDPKHKGKIKWISIDGVADLVENSNDIIESNKVAKKLMKWRKEYKCHINCVIHNNSNGEATGHLGSYVQKRSETVIDLEDTDPDPKVRNSPIQVVQAYSRGASFDYFHFKLNEETLPYECDIKNESW